MAVILVTMLAWGCGNQVTPLSSATEPPSASLTTQSAAPIPSPSPAYADTLRIGSPPGPDPNSIWNLLYGFRDSAGTWAPVITLGSIIYSTLYRYDARLGVVPDLADGPCVPQGDGTVIRCRIIETTFQDGTPLTADDVAYSYQLAQRQPMLNWYLTGGVGGDALKEVRIVDPRTVDFVLPAVDPPFLNGVLPGIEIFPRHAIEAAYADFVAATKDLKAADLTKLADAIDEETGRDPPVCNPRLDAVEALLPKIGVRLYLEDFTHSGAFDACTYMKTASAFIRQAATALSSTGLDAVAAAFGCFTTSWQPIGTGPYRFLSEDAKGVHLEAWPGYHGGLAATRYLDFVPAKGDGTDVVDGTIDIYQGAIDPTIQGGGLGPAFVATAASHGVRVATLPQQGFMALVFNVRPGRLFADVNLRRALQLCIDLPRDVDAATGGAGTPLYAPFRPGSWAYDSTLPKPARDIAAARKLIEGAGWQLGSDGIYAKDGVRLTAALPFKGDEPQRVKMADLIALQARDCGMDLRSDPVTGSDMYNMLYQYPPNIPGTKKPFDLAMVFAALDTDQDKQCMFISSGIIDAKHPDGCNFMGFSDPVVDRLAAAGMATYDQTERASLYRQMEQELAVQLPAIYLWAGNSYDVVRSAVATVAGPLDLTVPNWGWQPERMVVAVSPPGP